MLQVVCEFGGGEAVVWLFVCLFGCLVVLDTS